MRRGVVFALLFILMSPVLSAESLTYRHVALDGPVTPTTVTHLRNALQSPPSFDGLIVELQTPGGPENSRVERLLKNYNGPVITYSSRSNLPAGGLELLRMGDVRGLHPETTLLLPEPPSPSAVERGQPHFLAFFRAAEQLGQRILSDMFYGVLNRGMTGLPVRSDQARKQGLVDRVVSAPSDLVEAPQRNIKYYGMSWGTWLHSWLLHPDFIYLAFITAICLLLGGFYTENRRIIAAGSISLLPTLYALMVLPVYYLSFIVLALGGFMMLLDLVFPSFGVFTVIGAFLFYAGSVTIFTHPGLAVSFSLIMTVLVTIIGGFTIGWGYYILYAVD